MSLVQPSADPTPVVVRMFPDWGGCSGLWGDGGALDPVADLGLSPALAERCHAWTRFWADHHPDLDDGDSPQAAREFLAEGHAILAELLRALPLHVTVRPEFT